MTHILKRTTLLAVSAAIGLGVAAASPAMAQTWADGNGKICLDACKAGGKLAIASGTFAPTGAHLWICVANANNEGERAGYNLADPSDRAGVCSVGWGGKEVALKQYKCLCK